ncbi:hypothetical protein GCM10022416_33820 [Actinomadura keratinilytica]|uniref:Uncharacterized protein n=1 Tax=Actinomadura keratinilytica TaxID=547461 RepID=A0ABP7YZF7_9ACTN
MQIPSATVEFRSRPPYGAAAAVSAVPAPTIRRHDDVRARYTGSGYLLILERSRVRVLPGRLRGRWLSRMERLPTAAGVLGHALSLVPSRCAGRTYFGSIGVRFLGDATAGASDAVRPFLNSGGAYFRRPVRVLRAPALRRPLGGPYRHAERRAVPVRAHRPPL